MVTNRPIKYSTVLNKDSSGNRFVRKSKALIDHCFYFIEYLKWKMYLLFSKGKRIDHTKIKEGSIPILLNNFNRLESLKELISWLMTLETPTSIIILDNKSTYLPLLNYYASLKNSPIQVIKMTFNSGRFGLIHYFKKLKKYNKIVISDCDLVPYDHTPKDVLTQLSNLLNKYPEYNHIGVSLEIQDIPNTYPLKKLVIDWEKRFWPPYAREINSEAYEAEIDTTFSMFRSNSTINPHAAALRTKRPYTLKHVDWYLNPKKINQEYRYYISTCSSFGSWTRELVRWKRDTSHNQPTLLRQYQKDLNQTR